MYRQMEISTEDQDRQRIVWAPEAGEKLVDFRLRTATYGMNCASYLAIRTLLQLVQDEGSRFSLGAQCLQHHTYVDDIFAGANDLQDAVNRRDDLTKLLSLAGIKLDKWAVNHPDLLPMEVQQTTTTPIDSDKSVKTLGIHWNSTRDEFRFKARNFRSLEEPPAKRVVLSDISRLFDPLGWLAPITVVAKILLQDLWVLKCEKDAVLPEEVCNRWSGYCDSLSGLHSLLIPRWLGNPMDLSGRIHGFSDASSRPYAAAVYPRLDNGNGCSQISLLAAKTKVAPVKTVSIPKLELCGAAMLVKLIVHFRELNFLRDLPVFAWSDSQVALTWIRKHPLHWKIFIANRVFHIQAELPIALWSHVPTKENPADLATRGVKPANLAVNSLWWHGP